MSQPNITTRTEIERKFLISPAPDPRHPLLANAAVARLEQTYLVGEPGSVERVRAASDARGGTRYFHTVKRRVSSLSREEREREIGEREYHALLARRDPDRGTIRKTRYRFPYKDIMFELDLFDAPPGLALLEVELRSEDSRVELPPFAGAVDISADGSYSSYELARTVQPADGGGR